MSSFVGDPPVPGDVYSLLVGINRYRAAVRPLQGCLNDIDQFVVFLQARVTNGLEVKTLKDSEATRDAIIATFRSHLGRASHGDVALFYFSGHGSEEPVAPEHAHLEPTGRNQTLVCHDSRQGGVWDLADKELAVLIDEITMRGAHTVVILDCCHSGGATRELAAEDVVFRWTEPVRHPRPASAYLEGALERQPGRPDNLREMAGSMTSRASVAHIALSACESFQKARETQAPEGMRGVFSRALLSALATLGPTATYRDLVTSTRCHIENTTLDQVPVLYPRDLGGLADQPFLGGVTTRSMPAFTLRFLRGTWEVDAGSCHGISPPLEGEAVEFTALTPGTGATPSVLGRARATEVEPTRTTVAPIAGWSPANDRQYPVVITSVPLPRVGARVRGDAESAQLVERAISTAGSGGGPSPHIRLLPEGASHDGPCLVVRAEGAEGAQRFRVLRPDGTPAAPDMHGPNDSSARQVVAVLEHIARWQVVKSLDNPGSSLRNLLALEVVPFLADDPSFPADRDALVPDAVGEIRLSYRMTPEGKWVAPRVYLRIRNCDTAENRRLFCAVLNLTDRYRIHSSLFPGTWIEAGRMVAGLEGRPIQVSLPPGREICRGALVRDWLKLVVADRDFNALGFELPRLGEPPSRGATIRRAPSSTLDRLAGRALTRDASDEVTEATVGDWATSIVPLVTVVPDS